MRDVGEDFSGQEPTEKIFEDSPGHGKGSRDAKSGADAKKTDEEDLGEGL